MKFDRRISFLKKSWKKINNRFSSIQIIVFYYLAMTVLSLILFSLPFFREPGSHVSFLDMLFMAISTISVTGLTTFDINSVFNDAGILMLEVLFHIGGLGIMMITTFFFIVSKRRITFDYDGYEPASTQRHRQFNSYYFYDAASNRGYIRNDLLYLFLFGWILS